MTRETSGTWSALPVMGPRVPLRGQHLTAGVAGVFLGVCEQGRPPWVRLGRWQRGAWDWSAPWTVPPPPSDEGAPSEWRSTVDEVESIWLAIDRLDPLRLAINRTEYQGGSHGVVVGHWGRTFAELASPTDSDIRFGQPLVLRGDELWSHDLSSLWHFRRVGDTWHRAETDCRSQLGDDGELGWIADVSSTGRWVFQDVWQRVAAIERLGRGFVWTRTLPCTGNVIGLAQTSDGLVIVDRASALVAEIVLYDDELRPIWRWTVDCPDAMAASIEGHRVLLHHGDSVLVFDLRRGAATHRLRIPSQPSSLALHGELAVVISGDELGAYELT